MRVRVARCRIALISPVPVMVCSESVRACNVRHEWINKKNMGSLAQLRRILLE